MANMVLVHRFVDKVPVVYNVRTIARVDLVPKVDEYYTSDKRLIPATPEHAILQLNGFLAIEVVETQSMIAAAAG